MPSSLDVYRTYGRSQLVLVGGLSRSGTTLLSAALDAHPEISAGAELIPTPSMQLDGLATDIKRSNELTDDFSVAGKLLRAAGGNAEHGSFLTRCYRAGLRVADMDETVAEFLKAGVYSLETFKERLFFAVALISKRAAREESRYGSFKLNAPSISDALAWLPRTFVIALVRNPMDVVESHVRNSFPKTPRQVCDAWVRYVREFRNAAERCPDRVLCLRYEDLVTSPKEVLKSIFDRLTLDMHEGTLKFHGGDSAILKSRHPNTDSLRQGFFVDAVGRGNGLDPDCLAEVRRVCSPEMLRWNYA